MKEHPTHNGYYLTQDGKIFSAWKPGGYPAIDFNYLKEKSQRIKDGYKIVDIKNKTYYVHRLLLETFNPKDNTQELVVNHKDKDRSNNNLSNLEWTSQRENVVHGMDMHYLILDPHGNTHETNNLKEFCQQRNLSSSVLLLTLDAYKGKRGYCKTHKGYKLLEKNSKNFRLYQYQIA
jgi:hypothetical protein